MKKLRKYLLSSLALLLVAVLSITGTIAYLTDSDTAVNIMVLGEINIEQHEQDRNGNTFVQGQSMLPLVGTTANKDANGYPSASNYIDKIVTVENTGKNAAYVRTFIAIPVYHYDGQTAGDASLNVVHWNGYSQGDAAPNYPAATRIPGTEIDVTNDWSWGKDASASVWPGNHGDWNVVKDVEMGGQAYDIYVVTHVSAVQPGAITAPNMIGVYLDSKVDYDHAAGVYTYEGKVIEGFDGTVEVLVGTQAVQYDIGWGDAWTALDTAFGTPDVGHPWVDDVEMPVLVDNADDLSYYIGRGESVTLTSDIVIDDATVVATVNAGDKVVVDLNGYGITATLNSATEATALFHVKKGATLVIEGEGVIEVTANRSLSKVSAIINNESGNVVINGGTYKMNYGSYDDGYLIPTIVDNNSTLGQTTTTINGGEFYHTRNMFRNFGNHRTESAVLTIKGGVFFGDVDDAAAIWNQKTNGTMPETAGYVVIEGGEFHYMVIDDEHNGSGNVVIDRGIDYTSDGNGSYVLGLDRVAS